MSDYPLHLFRVPGPYGIPPKSYAVAGASDDEEALALLERGWFLTLEEARAGKAKADAPEAEKSEEKASVDGEGPEGENTSRINALRAEYRELASKRGGPNWDEATYEKKIAELKGK